MSSKLTPALLAKAIEGEQNAIAAYEHMKQMTSDGEHLTAINHIVEDERKHLRSFEELCKKRFGEAECGAQINAPAAHTFQDALRHAVNDELESYEFYRDVYMGNSAEQVRHPFFEAMTDEIEHAVRLNLMYSRELEKRLM